MKTFKTVLIMSMMCMFIAQGSYSQTSNKMMSQAERDWRELDSLKGYFCDYPEGCNKFKQGTSLERQWFIDKVYRNRVRMAENFLHKYRNDPHYYDVLKFYFSYLFEPLFIQKDIPDSLATFLSQPSKKDRSLFFSQKRALPLDREALDRWLMNGDAFAADFLKSNATSEQKAEIEIRLLGRDLNMAIYQYQIMDIKRIAIERDYWERFDASYWEPFLERAVEILNKYPDQETSVSFVQQLIAIITDKNASPQFLEAGWVYFLKETGANNPLAGHVAIDAVQRIAKESLEALIDKSHFDETQPLEMILTTIEGNKIKLANLRGKVVLLDFWSIRCAPCINEMPHVQKLYNKYSQYGFEVIGLASESDMQKEQIIKIIDKQKATWPQCLDKGMNADISYHTLFNISELPTVWLIDKDGRIVDNNARGVRLEPLLRKYLELDK